MEEREFGPFDGWLDEGWKSTEVDTWLRVEYTEWDVKNKDGTVQRQQGMILELRPETPAGTDTALRTRIPSPTMDEIFSWMQDAQNLALD